MLHCQMNGDGYHTSKESLCSPMDAANTKIQFLRRTTFPDSEASSADALVQIDHVLTAPKLYIPAAS